MEKFYMGMDGELTKEPVMNHYEQKRLEHLTEEFHSFVAAWYKAKRGELMGQGFNKATDDDMWFVEHCESLSEKGKASSEGKFSHKNFKSPKSVRD